MDPSYRSCDPNCNDLSNISGEGGSHLPPKEVPEANYGRLLKGFIGVTEDYTYKL